MTKSEAIAKIEEMGLTATLWEKHGLSRIYIEWKFNGSKRTGGFIGNDKTELSAMACGKKTKRYEDKLDLISTFDITWLSSAKKVLTSKEASSKAAYEISMESSYNEFLIGL